jgi:hypothetical protein
MYANGRPSGGRPKGAVNATTRSIQMFCRSICEDPEYRATVLERARNGTLGAMEPVILAYAYGKPKEHVEIAVNSGLEQLSQLSMDELAERAEAIAKELRWASAVEAAIGADYVVHQGVARQPALEASTGADSSAVSPSDDDDP